MRIHHHLVLGFAVLATTSSGAARVDDVGVTPRDCGMGECAHDDSLDFVWERSAFDDVDMDSGWVPDGASVQVRVGVKIQGTTEVALGGSLDGDWTTGAFQAAVSGVKDTGNFRVGYGLEVVAKFRFNVSVLGKRFNWEGDIPTPATIPKDLMLSAETSFTPFFLPGSSPDGVVLEDETGRAAAFSVGIGSNFVNVPGVAGKVSLDIRGTLRATYSDREIRVGENLPAMVAVEDIVEIEPPSVDGFGANYEAPVDVQGNIEYVAGVTLYPNVELRILGFTIIDKDLLTLHFDIPGFNVGVDFEAQTAHLDLPDAAYQPQELAVVGPDGAATFHIDNIGDAPLRLDLEGWPDFLAPFATPFIIEPGASGDIVAMLNPDYVAIDLDEATTVSFRTNDPDQPVIEVALTVSNRADAGEDDSEAIPGAVPNSDAGCACRTSGPAPTGNLALMLLGCAMFLRRRLRQAAIR